MDTAAGHGQAIGHHGELVQGVFEDNKAQLRRALVSLPCRHLKSRATFQPSECGPVTVTPTGREKARRAAALTLEWFASPRTAGHLTIDSNIPVGRGLGSSTADVLASILAVLDWLRIVVVAETIMQIAIRAESACDSTFYDQQAVLFAHRDGIVMESFRKPLPPIDVISIDATPGATVDTVEFEPARYDQPEVEAFRPLRSLLRRAIEDADIRLLGRAARASARINDRFLPKPRIDEMDSIGARFGAIGIQVAHSGTVVGLMFDALDEKTPEDVEHAAAELSSCGFDPTVFRH